MTDNDKITPIFRPKLVTPAGTPAVEEATKPTPPVDEGRDFLFTLRDGQEKSGKGFLIANAAFAGLGKSDGFINLIVPMDMLYSVENIAVSVC